MKHRRIALALAALLALVVGAAFAETIDELRSAAERGDVGAQLALAGAYYRGEEVPRDYAEAIRWVTLAAERGILEAQIIVAFAYLTENFSTMEPLDDLDAGIVPRSTAPENLTSAYAWLPVAAVQPVAAAQQRILFEEQFGFGHLEAREARDQLEELMTVEQIAVGQRMAHELWERTGDSKERAPADQGRHGFIPPEPCTCSPPN